MLPFIYLLPNEIKEIIFSYVSFCNCCNTFHLKYNFKNNHTNIHDLRHYINGIDKKINDSYIGKCKCIICSKIYYRNGFGNPTMFCYKCYKSRISFILSINNFLKS